MECSLDDQDRLRFKLSEPVVVVYNDENIENMVRKVLGHICGCWRRCKNRIQILKVKRG